MHILNLNFKTYTFRAWFYHDHIPLTPHFKLALTLSLKSVEEHEYLSHVSYVSVVGSLMYAIVCTRPDLSHAVSMVSRYMHDPGKEYWEAMKWILW